MRHHAPWVLLLAACSTSVATPPSSTVSTSRGAAASEMAAPIRPAPSPTTKVDREEVLREVAATCEVERVSDTTLGMKEALAEELRCHERRVADAVSRAGGSEGRFQADWAEATRACCRLTEESAWVDPDAGTRDWGSLMGLAELNCRIARQADRLFFLKAKAAGDANAVMDHFRDVEVSRDRVRRDHLNRWETSLAALPEPSPGGGRGQVTKAELASLRDDVHRLRQGTPSLAGALCGDWSTLREAAGGRKECVGIARAHLTRCLQPSPYSGE